VGWSGLSRHPRDRLAVADAKRDHDRAIREVMTLLGHTNTSMTERTARSHVASEVRAPNNPSIGRQSARCRDGAVPFSVEMAVAA
jgi:hypothetical protein